MRRGGGRGAESVPRENQRPIAVLPPWSAFDTTFCVSVFAAQLEAEGGAAAGFGGGAGFGAAASAAGGGGEAAGALSPVSDPNQRLTVLPLGSAVSSLTAAFQPLAGAASAVRAAGGSAGSGGGAGGGAAVEPPKLGTIRLHTLSPEEDSLELVSAEDEPPSALATAAPPSSAISFSTSLELEALRASASSASPWLDSPAAL